MSDIYVTDRFVLPPGLRLDTENECSATIEIRRGKDSVHLARRDFEITLVFYQRGGNNRRTASLDLAFPARRLPKIDQDPAAMERVQELITGNDSFTPDEAYVWVAFERLVPQMAIHAELVRDGSLQLKLIVNNEYAGQCCLKGNLEAYWLVPKAA